MATRNRGTTQVPGLFWLSPEGCRHLAISPHCSIDQCGPTQALRSRLENRENSFRLTYPYLSDRTLARVPQFGGGLIFFLLSGSVSQPCFLWAGGSIRPCSVEEGVVRGLKSGNTTCMFLRKKRKKSGGEIDEYWSLCETVRTAEGPRQRVVASLCKLDEQEVRAGGWDDIEGLLGGRPVRLAHQMELGESPEKKVPPRWERVDAHILVCFLALALWRTLEQWMHAKGLGTCARKLIEAVSTIKSMDVILPVERAGIRAEMRLRVVAKPESDVAQLLARLGLQLPRQSKIIVNVVPKIA